MTPNQLNGIKYGQFPIFNGYTNLYKNQKKSFDRIFLSKGCFTEKGDD